MALCCIIGAGLVSPTQAQDDPVNKIIPLPAPEIRTPDSLEGILKARRSVRDFAADSLTLTAVGQLLWAAQGVTHPDGLRTAPSAGALYPLEVYLVAGEVKDLEPGLYRYLPAKHALEKVKSSDLRKDLCSAALEQTWIEKAPAALVITAVYRRVTKKYGERGVRYAHIEAGAAAQNIYLEATALGLGTTYVGAFDDERVGDLLGIPAGEFPLAVMPVGKPR